MYEQESIQICLCCKTFVFFFFHFCSSFLRIERSFFFSCFGGLYFTVNIVWLTEIQCAPRLLLSIHFLSGNLYCHSYTTFVYNVCINGAHVSWESVFFLALVFFPFVERIKSRWTTSKAKNDRKTVWGEVKIWNFHSCTECMRANGRNFLLLKIGFHWIILDISLQKHLLKMAIYIHCTWFESVIVRWNLNISHSRYQKYISKGKKT